MKTLSEIRREAYKNKNPYVNLPFVKFKGKFRDLIPLGWKFQKMYASSYRSYILEPAKPRSDSIYIFQHFGGYVEVCSLLEYTHLLVTFLSDSENRKLLRESMTTNSAYFALDRNQSILEILEFCHMFHEDGNRNKQWSEIVLGISLIEKLEEMIDSKIIEVVE
jgi:hypothetical protein